MPPPAFSLRQVVGIEDPIVGFKTPEAAHDLDWEEGITVPRGAYVVTEQGRNGADQHDHELGDGYYYRLEGLTAEGLETSVAWVRQYELLKGQSDG